MKFIKKIAHSHLFKITSLNSLSVLIKIATGLITSKLLAVFVGPSGIALVGNLRNFMTSLESISTLGFQNGIVKYVAENDDNKSELNKIISTVFLSLLIVTISLSVGLLFFTDYFNAEIFGKNYNYSVVIKAVAIALPWYALSLFFLSVINGLGKFKEVIVTTILGNLLGLILSLVLIYQFQTLGALLSIVISPAVLIFVTFYFLQTEISILKVISWNNFDFKILKNLASFSLMALVAALFGPIVSLAIRKNIIANLGIEQAGFYETISRISTYYLLFVTTILTVYYLPKLIKAKTDNDTKIVFYNYYKYIFSIYIIGTIVIYFSRFFIIKLLFTDQFLPVTDLFLWQLIGDVFKCASLILGFNFFAKKMTKAFVVSEIASLFVLYFGSIYFIKQFGINGAVIGYAVENAIYFIALVAYFRKKIF